MPPGHLIDLSAEHAAPFSKEDHARVDMLNRRADEQLSLDAKGAFELASEARQLAEHCGYREGRATALFNQAMCSQLQSDYEAALSLFRIALALYEELGDQSNVANTLRAVGFACDNLGDYPRALAYHLRALKISVATGDQVSRANSLRTIGLIYTKAGNAEQGLVYYRQSLEISQGVGDRLSIAKALNSIGVALRDLNRCNEALSSLSEGLAYFRESGNQFGQAKILNNLGVTLSLVGRFDEAEEALMKALSLSRQLNYTHGEMNALLHLGKFFANHDKLAAATDHLLEALACAEKMKAKPARYECHQALVGLYKKLGDHRSALMHCEAYHALERDVFNEQSDRKLKGLQIGFQLSEAQRESEIHRLRNVELAKAYEDMHSLNQALQLADQVKNELLAQLEKQNQEDGLTGLFNRRYLDECLATEFRRALRHDRRLSIALADIDFFKRINDQFSHVIGDETLKAIAAILRDSCRCTDVVGRYGGEEFVIILLETDAVGAARVCEKIRVDVETHDWSAIHPGLHVTISIGISDDVDVASPAMLLAAADAKLYEAKNHGRNLVRW